MKLQDGEKVVRGDGARYYKAKLNAAPGVLTLTDRRLVFDQRHIIASAFGLLGALVLGPILPRKVLVDLPLSQVASFSRGQQGLNKSILVVSARDGQQYRFVAKYDTWVPVLTMAGIPQTQPMPQ